MAEAQDEAHDSGMSPGCCPVKHLVDTVILELVDLGGRRLQEAHDGVRPGALRNNAMTEWPCTSSP